MNVRVGGDSLMPVAKELRAGVGNRAADRDGPIAGLEKLLRQRALIRFELFGIKRVGTVRTAQYARGGRNAVAGDRRHLD